MRLSAALRLGSWLALTLFALACLASWNSAASEPVTNEQIQKLVKERLEIVSQLHELTLASYRHGETSLSEVLEARSELLTAKLDASETKAQRIQVLEEMVKLAEETREHTQRLAAAAEAPQTHVLKAKAHVLAARIRLERERVAP